MQSRQVLPPTYFLSALALTSLAHYIMPFIPIIPAPWHLGGIALVIAGLILVVLPARTFQSKGTAIKPFETPSALVQEGFFSISRNPMYLGMVLVVLGVATILRGAIPFVVPFALAIALHTIFIRHEEQSLEATFGELYRLYKSRVRRWL